MARKRKSGKREPSGRLQRPPKRDREADIMAPALEYRARRVGANEARSHLAGSALGRLALAERITRQQYDAGTAFQELAQKFRWACMIPRATAQSTAWIMVSSGFAPPPVADETPEERDLRVRIANSFTAVVQAVQEADRERGQSRYPAMRVLHRVVIEDCDDACLTRDEVGDLRVALNAAGRALGVIGWRAVA